MNSIMSQQAAHAPIRVLITEDDPVTRRVLAAAVESEPKLQLIAAFDSVKPTLAWLEAGEVDLVLTDIGLPDGSGIDIIRACAHDCPSSSTMVITVSSDEENVLACIEAGASGYILKDNGALDIVSALLDLHAGGSPISPLIARKVLTRMRSEKKSTATNIAEDELTPILTKREAKILDLIARGNSYDKVAKLLFISVSTVQTHIKHIYGKLSVHSRGEAVFEAQRRGLLQISSIKENSK